MKIISTLILTFFLSFNLNAQDKVKLIGDLEIQTSVSDSSIFIGANAGLNDFGGRRNTFVGANSGMMNSGGEKNVFIGYNSGKFTNQGGNVFLGHESGMNNSNYNNIFIGNSTGKNNTGFENTMIGTQAGLFSDGSGHVFLGSFAGIGETGNNKLYIENSNSASPLIYGEFDNDLVRINGNLGISNLDQDENADSLVVWLSDGTLGWKSVSDLPSGSSTWTLSGDTISTTKLVGIGTNSPVAKLNLVGPYGDPLIPGTNSNGILRIGSSTIGDALDIGKKTGGTFDAWLQAGFSGTADPISLQPLGGNVGIGLTSPSEKLEVAGNVKVAGIISGVSDPVNAQDAVTKSYLNQLLLDFALATIVDTSKTVQGLLTAGIAPTNILASGIDSSYFIGKNHEGGIIFYMQANGTGLVSAPSDQSVAAEWGCFGTAISGADGMVIGTGNQNTIDIEAGCGTGGTAADICANLNLNGFSDWFLPSIDELHEIYLTIGPGASPPNQNIGNFNEDQYWSSTEFSDVWAYRYIFISDTQASAGKAGGLPVRAVRAF